MKMEDSVPKRRNIKFRRRGITQKKAYDETGDLGSCDRVSRAKCEERENQQDAKISCLLSTSVPTCFGHHYAHLQENKERVLLHMVYCAGSAGCGW